MNVIQGTDLYFLYIIHGLLLCIVAYYILANTVIVCYFKTNIILIQTFHNYQCTRFKTTDIKPNIKGRKSQVL